MAEPAPAPAAQAEGHRGEQEESFSDVSGTGGGSCLYDFRARGGGGPSVRNRMPNLAEANRTPPISTLHQTHRPLSTQHGRAGGHGHAGVGADPGHSCALVALPENQAPVHLCRADDGYVR